MKSTILIICYLMITTFTFGQTPTPVKWSFDLITETDGNYTVRATANISDEWFVYSSKMGENGPIPTSMDLGEDIKPIGSIKEPLKSIKAFDDLFEMEVIKFSKKAIFEQKIKVGPNQKAIEGHIRFMTCDGSRCLPPKDIAFSLPIKR